MAKLHRGESKATSPFLLCSTYSTCNPLQGFQTSMCVGQKVLFPCIECSIYRDIVIYYTYIHVGINADGQRN